MKVVEIATELARCTDLGSVAKMHWDSLDVTARIVMSNFQNPAWGLMLQ